MKKSEIKTNKAEMEKLLSEYNMQCSGTGKHTYSETLHNDDSSGCCCCDLCNCGCELFSCCSSC